MNLAFVSYETQFAPCGGIAAVMARLPAHVQAASRRETIVITPFHHRIERTSSLGRSHEGMVGVFFEGRTLMVNIYRHDDKVPHYFLLPEDARFFAGARHPYDMSSEELLRDSLFFGAAAARALHVIGPGQRWNLLLQDWECATVALALADHPGTHRSFLTLHNSYDRGVSDDELWRAGMNANACSGSTILQRALGLAEHAVFTVSDQFAADFTEDVLQTRIMAPQLQGLLRQRLLGIDNGPFVDLAVGPEILSAACAGTTDPLRDWKAAHRREFLETLSALKPDADRPVWGRPDAFTQADAPWFVMAGRDDSRQKGYDVAAYAVAEFLDHGGKAGFLFFPNPGDEGRAGLRFLETLAERYPHSVLVFPFMFREGFMSALRGATYGLMPSLYEPFGMSNEFYLNGTAGIGRATGGILQQIVPLRAAAACGRSVQNRAARWHAASAQPTGILFREKDGLLSETADWAEMTSAVRDRGPAGADRVQERKPIPLFRSMADELRLAILDGVRVFERQPQMYYRMLLAGIAHMQQSFSWERAAQDYVRHVL